MWEEVRRTLARLFARAGVQDVPAGRMTVGVDVRESDATRPPAVDAGGHEVAWQPRTDAKLLLPPQAQDGGGGADLATVATVIGGNAALSPTDCPVHEVFVGMDGGAVRVWNGPFSGRSVPVAAPVAVGPVDCRTGALLSGRVESRRDKNVLTLRGGRVIPALGRMADVPMTRARLVSDEGFAAERAHLASVSGVSVDDVALVGVFPRVPLAAVGQLAVGDGGNCLRIWLKSGALGPKAVAGTRSVTIIFGRQRSTGRTLQAVMAAPRPPD